MALVMGKVRSNAIRETSSVGFVSCREIFAFLCTDQRTNATNDDRIQTLLDVVVSKFLNKIFTEPVKSDADQDLVLVTDDCSKKQPWLKWSGTDSS